MTTSSCQKMYNKRKDEFPSWLVIIQKENGQQVKDETVTDGDREGWNEGKSDPW